MTKGDEGIHFLLVHRIEIRRVDEEEAVGRRLREIVRRDHIDAVNRADRVGQEVREVVGVGSLGVPPLHHVNALQQQQQQQQQQEKTNVCEKREHTQ